MQGFGDLLVLIYREQAGRALIHCEIMNFVARYEMKPGELFFFCFVFLNECKVLSLSSFVSYVLEVTSKEATNLYYILEIIRGAMGDQAWVLPKLKTLTHCL